MTIIRQKLLLTKYDKLACNLVINFLPIFLCRIKFYFNEMIF